MKFGLTIFFLLAACGVSFAEEKGNEFEFSMSSARRKPHVEVPETDFYGERRVKTYPHSVSEEKEEPKQGRHGWKRVDPYAEDE